MAKEIERKFLVHHRLWHSLPKGKGKFLRQGYLVNEIAKTIRVRVNDEQAWITLKGKTTGASRAEFEYEIPRSEGEQLLNLFSTGEIIKTRYEIPLGGHLWEVDVFSDENEGLIVAEIELQSETETFELPEWAAEEVTDDARYYNANLLKHPFSKW